MEVFYHLGVVSIQILAASWAVAIVYSLFALYVPIENTKVYRYTSMYAKRLREELYTLLGL